ncbi:MAG: aldolase [Oscillospiraceae bacterium]|nr:aldolase [Oscillospiraceae bacterium]
MLKLLYITNDPLVAGIADKAGVDRIFVDLEVLGKQERQNTIDSVKSHHLISDIPKIKAILTNSEMLVRVNPINAQSKDEIDAVIAGGADMVMLPMFETANEVRTFVSAVNKRVKTCLLVERILAVNNIDEILDVGGIDEIHIGLNDLHLSMHQRFLFEPLADGTVAYILKKAKARGIPCGFGGMAHLGTGELPAENILTEHYRLGSAAVILSRSFCKPENYADMALFEKAFSQRVRELRAFETKLKSYTPKLFEENRAFTQAKISAIAKTVSSKVAT